LAIQREGSLCVSPASEISLIKFVHLGGNNRNFPQQRLREPVASAQACQGAGGAFDSRMAGFCFYKIGLQNGVLRKQWFRRKLGYSAGHDPALLAGAAFSHHGWRLAPFGLGGAGARRCVHRVDAGISDRTSERARAGGALGPFTLRARQLVLENVRVLESTTKKRIIDSKEESEVEKKEAMGFKASNSCDQKTESGLVSRRARASRFTTC
jgi:hypothetical protein